MTQPIITVKNISKKYNITHQQGGYVALRDVMTNVAKKPFSFLKRKIKAKVGNSTREEFWALKDIDFEIQKGEAVGIIGANGAGKSTLLKILTGITPPTTGEIKMRGKVASLLEVGTGFHPELTGRENIFLNGAILGMTKEEIAKKFDAIVDFSGVRKFIDTPVKRYSSGMMVRLGFSVAAHMEPDILLVDEVLAVGDAEFQKKCLGKMDEVTSQAGRTILFVSHNMVAVQNLCKRCVLLIDGKIEMIGETKDVIDKYLNINKRSNQTVFKYTKDTQKKAQILEIKIKNNKGKTASNIIHNEEWKINATYQIKKICPRTIITLEFFSGNETMFYFTTDNDELNYIQNKNAGIYNTILTIPKLFLNPGNYRLKLSIQSPGQVEYDKVENIFIQIKRDENNIKNNYFNGKYMGFLSTITHWETTKISK